MVGSLLLGYYTPQGRLTYGGRVGTGMPDAEWEHWW
jgi:ATP-dependent DNA ligase